VVAELDQAQRVILDALGSRLGIPHAPALLSVFASFDTYELLAGGFGMPELQIAQLGHDRRPRPQLSLPMQRLLGGQLRRSGRHRTYDRF